LVSVAVTTSSVADRRRPAGFASTTVASCDEIGGCWRTAPRWRRRQWLPSHPAANCWRMGAGAAHRSCAPLAGEEVVHAREVGGWRGLGRAPGPRDRAAADPFAGEIAVENATEGGVRERYGALRRWRIAGRADSERARSTGASRPTSFVMPARRAIDEWSANKLGAAPGTSGRQASARARLAGELAKETVAVAQALGLPEATRAVELFAALG